jgi:hypothetical protein
VDRGAAGDLRWLSLDPVPQRALEQLGAHVAGEGRHDDGGSGADEAHRDGVDELLLGEPVVVVDEPLVQEWHDRQLGATGAVDVCGTYSRGEAGLLSRWRAQGTSREDQSGSGRSRRVAAAEGAASSDATLGAFPGWAPTGAQGSHRVGNEAAGGGFGGG